MVDTVKCSKWCSSSICTRFNSSSTIQSTGMGLGSSRGRGVERGSAPRCDPEREGTHCSPRLTQFPQGSASSHLTVRQLLPSRKREGVETYFNLATLAANASESRFLWSTGGVRGWARFPRAWLRLRSDVPDAVSSFVDFRRRET